MAILLSLPSSRHVKSGTWSIVMVLYWKVTAATSVSALTAESLLRYRWVSKFFILAFDELLDRVDSQTWISVTANFSRDRMLYQQDYQGCLKSDPPTDAAYSIQRACCQYALGKAKVGIPFGFPIFSIVLACIYRNNWGKYRCVDYILLCRSMW